MKRVGNKWIILAVIVFALGIFFRIYHFHDLLRFNADQARDASIASAVVENKAPLPLLGPKAGGTEFKLGPAFYYFQIASAKIFGNYPDKMAYPDLLFSILAIPLLYFFLREYFDKKTALGLTAIFAFSVFAIKYSRFAWNPNSAPFWSMLFLYAMAKISSIKKEDWKWGIVAGVAMGVGVQLHTLLLIFLPITALLILGYLLVKKKKVFKTVLIVFAMAIILNIPQFANEYITKGGNAKAFFGGVSTKSEKVSIFQKVTKGTVCFAQGNAYIVSGVNVSDTCETNSLQTVSGASISLLGLLIFLGGIFTGVRKLRREKDERKKTFLLVVLSYIGLAFIILVPLANEISMRFFLVLAFMPLVFLGLCLEYLAEKIKNKRYAVVFSFAVIAILAVSNFAMASQELSKQLKYSQEPGGSLDNVSLKEIELLSSFVLSHSDSKKIALDGSPKYISRVIKPMQYFTDKSNVELLEEKTGLSGVPVFYIGNSSGKNKILKERIVQSYEVFGRLSIYQLAK